MHNHRFPMFFFLFLRASSIQSVNVAVFVEVFCSVGYRVVAFCFDSAISFKLFIIHPKSPGTEKKKDGVNKRMGKESFQWRITGYNRPLKQSSSLIV